MHITKALREYRGTFPIKQEPDSTMGQPEESTDVPDLSPHGSSGSCLSISTLDGFSDRTPWMFRSLQTPSLANFSYDSMFGMGTSPVKFGSIHWTNDGHSVPRSVPSFSMEETNFMTEEELPPLQNLSMGSEALPADSGSSRSCDMYTLDQFPGMWSVLNDDGWG